MLAQCIFLAIHHPPDIPHTKDIHHPPDIPHLLDIGHQPDIPHILDIHHPDICHLIDGLNPISQIMYHVPNQTHFKPQILTFFPLSDVIQYPPPARYPLTAKNPPSSAGYPRSPRYLSSTQSSG